MNIFTQISNSYVHVQNINAVS